MGLNRYSYRTGTIISGAALSGAIPVAGLDVVGILIPAAWTAAGVTLQASHDMATFGNVFDAAGEVAFASDALGRLLVSTSLPKGAAAIKVRSGTAGAPVNQLADRVVTVLLRD